MDKPDVDISLVKKLVELVKKHGLGELTVEEGGLVVTVKGPAAPAPVQVVHAAPHAGPAELPVRVIEEPRVEAAAAPAVVELEGNIHDIIAPLVGVFYRAPAPDADNFVEVGDIIEVGTEVGLIEAMKVFSPIPSEVAGEVVALPIANGKLVQHGDVLVRIRLIEE